jgi:DHA1 family multidrug resistance protein-like MFS transporter
VPRVLKWVQDKKLLINALLLCAFSFLGVFLAKNYLLFVVSSVFVSLSNSFVQPLTQSLLSKETDEKSQGEIMGINSSYMSIGTIFGPIIGGLMAGVSVSFPFLGGSVFCLVCVFLAYKILVKPGKLISLEG